MLEVHLSTGRTLRFDLSDERDAAEWMERAKEGKMQAQITGLTITRKDARISLPRPIGFDPVFMFAEHVPATTEPKTHGGDRILCTAGDVLMRVMLHEQHRAARIDLTHEGRQIYNPRMR